MNAMGRMHRVLLTVLTISLTLSNGCSKLDHRKGFTCDDIPAGAAALPRIVVFGEIHGTDEAPRFVTAWICNLARTSPVVVGIEHPSSEQATLDRFMNENEVEPARRILAGSTFWTRDLQDGRTSSAMLAMLDGLRSIRRGGGDVRVVAVAGSGSGGGNEITENLKALAKTSDAKVVALLGNAHARKYGAQGLDGMSSPMFDEPYQAFVFANTGGTAWACAPVCEVQDLGRIKQRPERVGEFVLVETLTVYDGSVNLGFVHASLPAVRP